MSNTLIQVLLIGSSIAGLFLVARIGCALFSRKIVAQARKHWVIHLIWAWIAIPGILVFYAGCHPSGFPPRWWERRTQRQELAKRVQAAGGWEAIRRDCLAITKTNEVYQWLRLSARELPALPPALAILRPQRVDYIAPKLLGKSDAVPVVRIKVFGMHSTGGHSIPYFGLAIVTAEAPSAYPPPDDSNRTPGTRRFTYRKVADGVFEVSVSSR